MTDNRDKRLRKLFSDLPRQQAPPEFEERLINRIAGERARPAFPPVWLRTYAIPALSLLLVGVLSYVIYLNFFITAGDPVRTGSDTLTTPGSTTVPGTAPGAESRSGPAQGVQSPPASTPSGPEQRQVPGQPRPKAGIQSKSKTGEGGPSSEGNGGKLPGRVMMQQAVSDSAARADSIARRDTSAADSAHSRPDSLRGPIRHPALPPSD